MADASAKQCLGQATAWDPRSALAYDADVKRDMDRARELDPALPLVRLRYSMGNCRRNAGLVRRWPKSLGGRSSRIRNPRSCAPAS
jgi:hypothetical protein